MPDQVTDVQLDPDDRAPSRRRPVWMALVAGFILLLAGVGLLAHERASGQRGPAAPGKPFVESQSGGTALSGIGGTAGLAQDCTAWLLDAGSPGDARAVAVTTGRCVGIEDSATVLVGRRLLGATVDLRAFAPETAEERAQPVRVGIDRIEWASGRGSDLALVRLASTYDELAARGVRPIAAVAAPKEGTPVLVAGVPVEGIAPDEQHLRGSRCQVGAPVDVLLDGWYWRGARASDCPGIRGGSPGSPVLDSAGHAVGMVAASTIAAEDGHDCVADRPCEVRDGDVRFSRDTTYLVQVAGLAACLPGGVLTLGGDCPLEQPDGVVAATAERRAARPGAQVTVRVVSPPGVDAAVRTGAVGTVDCTSGIGWSSARAAREWDAVVALPRQEGWTLACVGSPRHPTPVIVEADSTPPDPGRIELEQQEVEGGTRVSPVADPPDLAAFRWVRGPGVMDCASAEGYVDHHGGAATVQADDLPTTVCVIAVDDAGNESDPATFRVE